MKPIQKIFYIQAILALVSIVATVPVEPTPAVGAAVATKQENKQTEEKKVDSKVDSKIDNKVTVTSPPASNTDKDLETSNSNHDTTYVLPQHHSPANTANGPIDPSIYAGYLTPEAFQQYLAQFANAFAPYGYPGYAPAPVYPAPYAVQTGYDGFLVPAPAATSLSASGAVASNSGSFLNALTNIIPSLMDSAIVRVIVTIIGAVLMVLFGGIVTTAICNVTPICDISFKTVSYLRGNDAAADVGRMLVEEMTPERVRRATEIVRSAIRKYSEMQNTMAEKK